ncbi:MAG: hypothetical protein C4527_16090 [Candidatus Omnitrophota bacterium]|nr:MAG: hypothetical protein C4527_16090 [Candidatus Omnitrophota bacterium]
MLKKIFAVCAVFSLAVVGAQAQVGIFDGNMDIDSGRLGAVGSASYDAASDTYTVNGSGHDIWDAADNFHFVYKQISGNFILTADVGISGGLATQDWIKSMLMARQDLTPGSVNVGTRVRRDGQYSLQWRTVANDTNSKGSTAAALRVVGLNGARQQLIRIGDTFYCLYQDPADGQWKEIEHHDVPMVDPIYVGLAVTAHDEGQIATGTFTNLELQELGIFENAVTLDSAHNAHVAVPGSITHANGVYTISGNGHDIWEAGDEGFFAYSELAGNNSISAKVKWIQAKGGTAGGNDWAKIGVMIRENGADPASAHYWIEMRCGAGDPALGDRTDAQWRPSTGAASQNKQIFKPGSTTDNVFQTDGLWLRTTRVGADQFMSEYSYDGSNWVVAHELTLPMQETVAYGIIITSHTDDQQMVIAEVSDVKIEPAGGASAWVTDHGDWVVEDGVMKMTASDTTDPKHAWIEQDFGADYTVQADVRIVDWTNAADMSRAGVGVRIQPGAEVQGLNLLFHQNEGRVQFLNDKRGWGPQEAIPWVIGAWYTLTMTIEGNTMSGSVAPVGGSGWAMADWAGGTTQTRDDGYPGLAGNSNVGEVWYDNFKVIVGGEVVFEDDFEDASTTPSWELMK